MKTTTKIAIGGGIVAGIIGLIYWQKPAWLGLETFKGGANQIQDFTADTGSLSVLVPHDSSALNDRIFVP